MTFDEQLEMYAKLLVSHGLNVQEGQIVNISTEAYHRDFAMRVVRAAYERGAKHVRLDLIDMRVERERILHASESDLEYVPNYIPVKYDELLDETAANLKLIGSEDPDIISDLDPKKVNSSRLAMRKAVKRFYDEGIGKSKVHWTVAAASTKRWGQKVFPDLGPEEAEKKLWDEILKACRADRADCLELWREHNDKLQGRAKRLTDMKIETLHFSGNGTDLRVGLSKRAVFKGGGDLSPRKVEFEPNIPTEEVFTTPDYRVTEGRAVVTRPFLVNGRLIENLVIEFENGEISSFSASSGEETFREYIASDPGAKRLGEVALVGVDSPVFQSGIVFQEILFDENAACHIAVGSAYKFCVEGGDSLEQDVFDEIGCNESSVHTDMMISSEEVNVTAKLYDGAEVSLIENGAWVL